MKSNMCAKNLIIYIYRHVSERDKPKSIIVSDQKKRKETKRCLN